MAVDSREGSRDGARPLMRSEALPPAYSHGPAEPWASVNLVSTHGGARAIAWSGAFPKAPALIPVAGEEPPEVTNCGGHCDCQSTATVTKTFSGGDPALDDFVATIAAIVKEAMAKCKEQCASMQEQECSNPMLCVCSRGPTFYSPLKGSIQQTGTSVTITVTAKCQRKGACFDVAEVNAK